MYLCPSKSFHCHMLRGFGFWVDRSPSFDADSSGTVLCGRMVASATGEVDEAWRWHPVLLYLDTRHRFGPLTPDLRCQNLVPLWFWRGFPSTSANKRVPPLLLFCHGRWSLAPAEAWVDQFEMHSPEGPPPLFAGEPDPPAASVAVSFNFEHPRTCLADVQFHAPMPPFWWMHPPGRMTMLGSAKKHQQV